MREKPAEFDEMRMLVQLIKVDRAPGRAHKMPQTLQPLLKANETEKISNKNSTGTSKATSKHVHGDWNIFVSVRVANIRPMNNSFPGQSFWPKKLHVSLKQLRAYFAMQMRPPPGFIDYIHAWITCYFTGKFISIENKERWRKGIQWTSSV